MKSLKNQVLSLALAASMLAVAVSAAQPAYASSPTFTANQTVANSVLGTNNQTAATTSVTANVPETKATRTITVNSVPTAPITLTIGTCAISITSAIASDVNCTDNTAAIATSTDTTAALIATRIRTITNLSDTGHGALTIGGSGSTASFTTTGTESSATAITATLSAGTDVTLTTVNTTGVIPVAQVWDYTPANVDVGDTFTAIINGTTVSYEATAATVANVTAGLTAAINASSQASAVTAADATTKLTVTSDTAGTAFTLTTATTNSPNTAQVVVFTPADVDASHEFIMTINGSNYGAVGSTVKEVVENLNSQLVANTDVSCTEDDTAVTCTSKTAGTAFTYDATVGVYHSSGGSGGSHHSKGGSGGTPAANNGTSTASPAAPALEHANANAAFNRDLQMGVSGSDVMALQAYLNAHGFIVASTGPGSKGNETMLFGPLTRAAVIKLQIAAGITPSVGYFGPKTRAYVAAHP